MIENDTKLKTKVLEELKWNPSTSSNNIGVIVKDGSVALSGMVNTFAEKMAAEQVTKRVKGVRAIAQGIEVRLPSSPTNTDEQIAERISHYLKWSDSLKDTNIQARVSKGIVTLEGEVKWVYQKRIAMNQIGDMRGVTGISNIIVVRNPDSLVKATDIKKQITTALHRRANLEASRVRVSVEDGKVTIDGSVDTFYERELIENAVWACSGVKGVVDHLRIT